MDLQLRGKTALVLGAGGGLGRATANALGAEGMALAVADHNAISLKRTSADLEEIGAKHIPLVWELSDLDSAAEHVRTVETALGPVDVLVNITGGPPPTPVLGQAPDLWSDQFRMMVQSVVAITDLIAPGMCDRGWGRVITSTSSGVIAPIPNLGLSNSLRSSLLGWSKTLSNELGLSGVTVNVVVPGRIATDRTAFLDEARADSDGIAVKDVIAASVGSIALGRYGTPQEFADVIAFLASERAAYITGSVIRVDGGHLANV